MEHCPVSQNNNSNNRHLKYKINIADVNCQQYNRNGYIFEHIEALTMMFKKKNEHSTKLIGLAVEFHVHHIKAIQIQTQHYCKEKKKKNLRDGFLLHV